MLSNLSSWWSGGKGEGEGEGEEREGDKSEEQSKEDTKEDTNWNKIASGLFQSVTEYATTLTENVKKQVKDTTTSGFIGEFQKEQDRFTRDQQRLKDASVPPWVGYNEEEQLKAQILEISADSRNVLREPPPEVEFVFDYVRVAPVAMVMLKEDERLQKLRFDLVPKKVSEEKFWRNYFYRVSLAKQSVQLSTLSSMNSQISTEERPEQPQATDNKEEKITETKEQVDSSRTISEGDEIVDEFISDQPYNTDTEQVNKETLKRELSQLGVAEKGDDENVIDESELWDELQAELKDLDLQDENDDGLLVNWEQEMEEMMKEENS